MRQLAKLLAALVVFSTIISAQALNRDNVKNYDNFVINLETGITSENAGVQRACIMLAGIHEIADVVPLLEDLLEDTDDNKTRLLIALSLYKINEKTTKNEFAGMTQIDYSPNIEELYVVLNDIYSDYQEFIKP